MYQIIKFPINLGCDKIGVELGADIVSDIISKATFEDIEFLQIPCKQIQDFNNKEIKDNMMYIQPIIDSCRILSDHVFKSLTNKKKTLIIGGDHSMSWGTISGALEYNKDIAVIYIDAHGDINTAKSSPSKHVHGIHMSYIMGIGEKKYNGLFSKNYLLPENIMYVGTRSLDEGEVEIIKNKKIKVLTSNDIIDNDIQTTTLALKEFISKHENIHISFDIDVLDPSIAPGTGVPEKNGIDIQHLKSIFNTIISSKKVISMDIVEFNPLLDIDNITLNNIKDLLPSLFF